MNANEQTGRKELATFLGLTFGVSVVFYLLIIFAGSRAHGQIYVAALMWTPGFGALATQRIFPISVHELGWRWPAARWVVLAYIVPLAYATVAYVAVWLAELSRVDYAGFQDNPLIFVILGSFLSLLLTTGEELGWRGFLVPALARTLSLVPTALLSGIIWAAWHMPLILFGDYHTGAPRWFAAICFTSIAVSLSLPLAWLRLRTGSMWPAAILHASHNLYVQGYFDRVTVDTGVTQWLTGEFGVALAITTGVTAWIFWCASVGIAPRLTPLASRDQKHP